MIAPELEVILHSAFVDARAKRHQSITAEHLLLALLNSPHVARLLEADGAGVEDLRKSLTEYIDRTTPVCGSGHEIDTQPNQGFQRAIQVAILKVHSSGRKELQSVDVLLSILSDKNSHAARLLAQHSVTWERIAAGAAPRELTPSWIAGAAVPSSAVGPELQQSLDKAFADAREKRHEFVTVEHLLLALLNNTTAANVLGGCGADMDVLRGALAEHIANQTPIVPAGREPNIQPTLGFQRVLQRAILHVQSSNKKEVTGANVLVALFGEKDSHAVYLLEQQHVDRVNVVTYLAHGALPESVTTGQTATDVQVVIYNDEYTPMQFVVDVLQEFFAMSPEDANEAMLEIHREGQAVCGLYARDDGAALVDEVTAYARRNGHPLQCVAVVPR
jgi:ATP-dependent Clp protease ATP-binding subunit ClpA